MRETEQKRAWAENKPIGRDELGRVHDEEDPRGADEALTRGSDHTRLGHAGLWLAGGGRKGGSRQWNRNLGNLEEQNLPLHEARRAAP